MSEQKKPTMGFILPQEGPGNLPPPIQPQQGQKAPLGFQLPAAQGRQKKAVRKTMIYIENSTKRKIFKLNYESRLSATFLHFRSWGNQVKSRAKNQKEAEKGEKGQKGKEEKERGKKEKGRFQKQQQQQLFFQQQQLQRFRLTERARLIKYWWNFLIAIRERETHIKPCFMLGPLKNNLSFFQCYLHSM